MTVDPRHRDPAPPASAGPADGRAEPLVATLVLGGGDPFEVGIAGEVFGRRRGEVMALPSVAGRWYDFRLCGTSDGEVVGLGGVRMRFDDGLETVARADLVIVPHCPKPDSEEAQLACGPQPCRAGDDVVDAVRAAHERGATVMSFCTGAFVLAQAGLLDRRRATTHWRYGRAFRQAHPQVVFVEDVLYVDEGDVMTSAGSAAGIDLSLHYIRREHGADVADLVARRMVVPPHRDGGQAQYVAPPRPDASPEPLAELLGWMLANLGEELSVEDLAERAAMSPRSFARHFQAGTGTTPHRWLTARRVDHARMLLETTDWPVDRIAREAGLGSATNLRARLADAVGVTPTSYRRRFSRAQAV